MGRGVRRAARSIWTIFQQDGPNHLGLRGEKRTGVTADWRRRRRVEKRGHESLRFGGSRGRGVRRGQASRLGGSRGRVEKRGHESPPFGGSRWRWDRREQASQMGAEGTE